MNKRLYFLCVIVINYDSLLSMSESQRRTKKIAIKTLNGDLALTKERVEKYNILSSGLKGLARASIIRIRGDISFNYHLLGPNEPLLKDLIIYYNTLVQLLKSEGQADDDDFFWEPVDASLPAQSSATIEEITPLSITPPPPATNPITVNTDNQYHRTILKYFATGVCVAATVVAGFYAWIQKTKTSSQSPQS